MKSEKSFVIAKASEMTSKVTRCKSVQFSGAVGKIIMQSSLPNDAPEIRKSIAESCTKSLSLPEDEVFLSATAQPLKFPLIYPTIAERSAFEGVNLCSIECWQSFFQSLPNTEFKSKAFPHRIFRQNDKCFVCCSEY